MKQQYMIMMLFCCLFSSIKAQEVTTLAGSGTIGSTDAIGAAASFYNTAGVCSDSLGNIYVADYNNHKIRKITPGGTVTTFAGSGTIGAADDTGIAASFYNPSGICSDISGNIYVADRFNHKIRKITPAGVVTTFAGSGLSGSTDATGIAASFSNPFSLCIDSNDNIYVADAGNVKIRKITPGGDVTTLAGSGAVGDTDGNGAAASFNNPYAVCADASNNIYVADLSNNKIRKITQNGDVTTFAGSGVAGSTDATGLAASFSAPLGICTDAAGNFYVADYDNHKIRKITPTGDVTTLAGSGLAGSTDGIGIAASFNAPTGVCTDASGNVYVGDQSNHKVRKISTVTGVLELNNNLQFSIYPNPSTSNMTMETKDNVERIYIYNSIGNLVRTETIHSNTFSVTELPAGFYILKIKTATQMGTTSFTKL